ncbi:MAG: sigma-70 family RNA polymerase sigma factor [Bacteroidales bacterium]|nr:sigma-70 family RNA polymerase sigma factor [Bacteroidales bacterium]
MPTDYTEMLEGCRRRNRQAQKALYDTFAPMAMGLCMRYARNRAEAEDWLQDGFVRVFEKIGQVRAPEQLGAWIYSVVMHVCIKQWRKQRLPMAGDGEEPELAEFPTDPFANEEVVLALQQIAPQQRVVFNLMAVEEYSYQEAAHELKCSEANVRALYSRAKSRLREILKPGSPES